MLELFYEKLAKTGYVEIYEYDNPRFIVSEERLYCVTEELLKFIRSELPDGVWNVRYGIALERLKSFHVKDDVL